MAKRKGKAGSPSPADLAPRFVLEDGVPVEVTTDLEAPIRSGRPKPMRGTPPPTMVTVNLQMRHTVNGIPYGPGPATVTPKMAQNFQRTEQMAMEKEDSLVRNQAFIIQFRGGLPTRMEVPATRFDEILAREELPINVMGGQR